MELKQLTMTVLAIVDICTPMRFTAADPETSVVWSGCRNIGKYEYKNGSAFQRNLNKVLESLVRNVNPSGFNTSSVVEQQNGNSTVYGFVQCRGDLESSDCEQCASTAKTKLVEGCYNTSGFIQLDGCFLRYDNYSFYNDNVTSTPISILCNTGNVSHPQQFINSVKGLLSNITTKAANSPKLLAADSVVGPSNSSQNISGFAQCWRYLSRTGCISCLNFASKNIFRCQSGAVGAQVGSKNCYLRYEIYEFFNSSVLSPPPGEIPPLSSGGKRHRVLGISLGVAAAMLVLIAVIGLWKWNFCSRLGEISRTGGEEGDSILMATIENPELIFEYDLLREATSNFNEENKLGEGGFGSVFKGILPDGREVAVKRLYMGTRQALMLNF